MTAKLHEAQERHAKFCEDTLYAISLMIEQGGKAIQESFRHVYSETDRLKYISDSSDVES